MIRFSANRVVVDDSDPEFILIGFADEEDGNFRDSLHFQRAIENDEQDVALGMDQVYVERGIQAGAVYGGITRVLLSRNRIAIDLDSMAAEKLGDREFEIMFELPPEQFQIMAKALECVFQGSDVFNLNAISE